MAYSATIESLDRLSVRSIMRGSTSTIAGVVGTLAVIVLCMAIYIPPAISIMKGSYFQSEFYTNSLTSQKLASSQDFKLAVVFRNRTDNTPANHSEIFQYAYSIAVEYLADGSDVYYQPMKLCSDNPNYFKDIQGAEPLSECFIFPERALFNLFSRQGIYTDLQYQLWAMDDPNPFTSVGNQLSSFQRRLELLLMNYYYEVLFTSKIINPDGTTSLVMNRFYSTEVEATSLVGTSWNQIIFSMRNTTMDLSIMPWRNMKNASNMVWLGEIYNYYLLDPDSAARYGVIVTMSEYLYQIRAFRYYKKVDFLLGVVGGAMLLFYLILWVPCNYINKTVHQITNTENLLLNHVKKAQSVEAENLIPTKVGWKYWISNPICDFLFPSVKKEGELVKEGERELDVVSILKKLKVVQRSLKKKELINKFQPKVLKLEEQDITGRNNEHIDENSINQSENNSVLIEANVQIKESFFFEQTVDKYGITTDQLNYIQKSSNAPKIFATNVTGLAIMGEQNSHLHELQSKNKWKARHDEQKKMSRSKAIFYFVCDVIEKFDFFGAKPNLHAGSHGSSFVGLCGVLLIIILTILTLYATLSNANAPKIMILEKFLPEQNFGFQLTPGSDLKFVYCSNYLSYLQGSNRYAMFRFFHENSAGRTYFNPVTLTKSDYAMFDLTKDTSPVDVSRCFTMQTNNSLFLGKGALDYGYIGFRIEPYCSSTPQYCQSTQGSSATNFIQYMNKASMGLFLPQNRFDPDAQKFINNLQFQILNINSFTMNQTSMEQTVYVDHVQILDDTTNFFMRSDPKVAFQGIAATPNTPYPLSMMLNSSSLYYQTKIKPSSQQINYIITTPKADTILGIIGGVIVIWYAIWHWLGKVYNNFQVRAAQADSIYAEDTIDENILMKLLAISPIPLCLLPSCFEIRNTITRMRQVDKKILNNLNYLWLVKYVDNIFRLSSTLYNSIEQQNLSKVYIKELIDESANVIPQSEPKERVKDEDFIDQVPKDDQQKEIQNKKLTNKVYNQSPQSKQSLDDEKYLRPEQEKVNNKEKREEFAQNFISGHPKPSKLAWMDTFEYQSSLTFKGKREVTSCCGGCCCLILLMFILIVVNFEVGIYLDRSDTKIGMTTSIMQPLAVNSNSTFNSNITLRTGSNFKLAVTFSSVNVDVPHNVSAYIASGVAISIFQKTIRKANGIVNTTQVEYPMVPCSSGYLTKQISSLVDPAYYAGEQLGYCAPDNLNLVISGIPEDSTRQSFTLSIYDRLASSAGRQNLQNFLQNYYPKFHYTVPNKDYLSRTITYEITSIVFDPFNITIPIQQNLTLSKMAITYNDQIHFSEEPYTDMTYNVNPFHQMEASYTGLPSESLYYNLTFDNSYLLEHYTLEGVKFYETFGIVGGLIAFFIFGFGCLATSFNFYRMRYLIGRELYLFEISKKKLKGLNSRGKVRKSMEQTKELSYINKLNQAHVFKAYLFSFVGAVWQNYNYDPILRRVTLIQQKVENDLSIFNIYKKLHSFRDTLNEQYIEEDSKVKPADIFLKHIYNPDPAETSLDNLQEVKGYAKRHGWTAFEMFAIAQAKEANVNLRDVFDSAFLENIFGVNEQAPQARLRNLQPTIATTSVNSEVMSRLENDD